VGEELDECISPRQRLKDDSRTAGVWSARLRSVANRPAVFAHKDLRDFLDAKAAGVEVERRTRIELRI